MTDVLITKWTHQIDALHKALHAYGYKPEDVTAENETKSRERLYMEVSKNIETYGPVPLFVIESYFSTLVGPQIAIVVVDGLLSEDNKLTDVGFMDSPFPSLGLVSSLYDDYDQERLDKTMYDLLVDDALPRECSMIEIVEHLTKGLRENGINNIPVGMLAFLLNTSSGIHLTNDEISMTAKFLIHKGFVKPGGRYKSGEYRAVLLDNQEMNELVEALDKEEEDA